MEKILVVEDDKNIAQLEIDYLNSSGYETNWISDGAKVIEELKQNSYDLLLLDLMLPNIDGYEICRSVRDEIDIPILMVTARTESVDVIRGLGLGADDYITKPFNPIEVQARVKSQLRRYMQLGGGAIRKDVLSIGGIELDDRSKEVSLDGEKISLTRTEYDILKLLMEHPGEVFSPNQIYEQVWQDNPYGTENTVAVHIRHLREKVEYNPAEPRYLKVVWGRGYKMEGQV